MNISSTNQTLVTENSIAHLSVKDTAREGLSTNSSKQTIKRTNKQHYAPWKINTWSYLQLYRGADNTGNQSIKFLKQGQTEQAVKTRERTVIYIDELNKRNDISDANKNQLRYLLISFKQHKQEINKIKSTITVETKSTTNDSSRLPPTTTRECAVCLHSRALDQYDGHYGDHCKHSIRTVCDECVYKHTKFTLENISKTNVKCPEPGCTEEFNHEGIHRILEIGEDKTLFEKYDLQITLQLLKQMPQFIMCAHPDCDSGQLHDSNSSNCHKVTCMKCQRDTCSFHRIIWHIELTCDEYDQQRVNDIPSKNWLRKNTKQCPKCERNIEKNGGCDHMTCNICKHQFCWKCSADYRSIMRQGLHQHRMTCSHYRPRYTIRTRSSTCTII